MLVHAPFSKFGIGKIEESQKHTMLLPLNGVPAADGVVHDGQEQL
jgi:hypothetical protein